MVFAAFGCSSIESSEAPVPGIDHSDLVLGVHQIVLEEVEHFGTAVRALAAAAPSADDDGWSDESEAQAVLEMRAHWRSARLAYHRVWAMIAIAFEDEEQRIELLYDVAINTDGPDANPFDGDGFVGMHAIERILWADQVSTRVAEVEARLAGYAPPRFPQTRQEAADFKDGLCAQLVSLADRLEAQATTTALAPTVAALGLQKTVEKQLKKLSAPLGVYESRYAGHTLDEMRANAAGLRRLYDVFSPWIMATGQAEVDTRVRAGLDALDTAYAALPGAALPAPPAGWAPSRIDAPPGDSDYVTLWNALAAQVDLSASESLATGLGQVAAIVSALPEKPAPDGLSLFGGSPGFPIVAGTEEQWGEVFQRGQDEFDRTFTASEGLGPVYIESSCSTCHFDAAAEQRIAVTKMTLLAGDGTTPLLDQSPLAFGRTIRARLAGGGKTPIDAPSDRPVLLADRAAPTLFGRGYLEAVRDDEIERIAAEQALRSDGISGRVHRVRYWSEPNPETPFHSHTPGADGLVGRLGLKSQFATVDDFVAGAYLLDMSITSPLRPVELPNPDGLTDDGRAGVDLSLQQLNDVSDWTRLIAIPERTPTDSNGAALFELVTCAVCHVPSLRTRADYPIAALADIDAPVYSDLLLHDMGPELSDGVQDGNAGPAEWRTAPLVALARLPTYLHDGSATTIDEAIRRHGGEAAASVAAYLALSEAQRAALVEFVESL